MASPVCTRSVTRANPARSAQVLLNPEGLSVWREGCGCVWRRHGVWRPHPTSREPELLRADYFACKPDGSAVNFGADYIVPLWEKLVDELHAVARPPELPRFILFAELHVDLNDVDNAPKRLPTECGRALSQPCPALAFPRLRRPSSALALRYLHVAGALDPSARPLSSAAARSASRLIGTTGSPSS